MALRRPLRPGWTPRRRLAIAAATASGAAATSGAPPVVGGAFPGFAYDGTKKRVGTAEYEQLRTNWAEVVPLRHAALASPADLEELRSVVRDTAAAGKRLRVVGSAHSFSHLCDAPDETMLSLAFMAGIGPPRHRACHTSP